MTNIINSSNEIEMLWFVLPKIIIATICGAIIGYDREVRNKVAGIRTNILICVGATIFTVVSIILAQISHSDPTRILSTIVTGIGFLGGGAIMRMDNRITGMTTAAFIWVVSAIGILCGMGSVLTPIIITIGLLIISNIFEMLGKHIKEKSNLKKDIEPKNNIT